jgi:uncharacterized protein
MNLYLDASALVKRYVAETGSPDVARAIRQAFYTSTSIISRAEVSAALAKAVRLGVLPPRAAKACLTAFHRDWPALIRVQINELTVVQADSLAWQHGLRGYDAVQLASAWAWQDALGGSVTFATFDKQLWSAARTEGLIPFPAAL